MATAITHFLLQSNNNSLFLQQTFHSPPTKCSRANLRSNHHSPRCIIKAPESEEEEEGGKSLEGKNLKKVAGVITKALQISVLTGGLLFSYDQLHIALAASGGRMGGSSFSSSRSRSSRGSYRRSPISSSSSSEVYSTQIGSPALMMAGNEVEQLSFMNYSIAMIVLYIFTRWVDGDIGKTSVLKLQVGSLGTDRSLQRDLNRIATVANTSNSKGLHFVLQESIKALLQHPNYWISGHSSVDVKWRVAGCEKLFDQLSVEERGKFDEETLVNVNNIRKKSATSQSSNGFLNEYIVVTIIVVTRRVLELPPIKSSAQLKGALQKLASIPSSNIMGVEVLWTPQKEDDSLTEQEMLKDYPLLHPL